MVISFSATEGKKNNQFLSKDKGLSFGCITLEKTEVFFHPIQRELSSCLSFPFSLFFNEFSILVRLIMKMNSLDRVCLDFDKVMKFPMFRKDSVEKGGLNGSPVSITQDFSEN